MLDEFLENFKAETGKETEPFDIESDYLKYVDGKPRYEGVRDFLNSRNIQLPEGNSESHTEEWSICGLGNRKNELFNQALKSIDIEVYNGSIDLVKQLKDEGLKLAVVSSSRNCEAILKSAKIENYFLVVVDGNVASDLGLKGKPYPDTYLEAAKQLGVKPERSVVIEDAVSGVQAGRSGNFGLVVGIARSNNADKLIVHGGDVVVSDLLELIQ